MGSLVCFTGTPRCDAMTISRGRCRNSSGRPFHPPGRRATGRRTVEGGCADAKDGGYPPYRSRAIVATVGWYRILKEPIYARSQSHYSRRGLAARRHSRMLEPRHVDAHRERYADPDRRDCNSTPVATATPVPTATPTPGSGSPTPSPSPTASASSTPGGSGIVLSPTSLDFPGQSGGPSGCSDSQSFTASEAGVSTFTAVSSNTSEVTVTSPSSGGLFTATQPASNTSTAETSITVSDGLGHTAVELVGFSEICLP
jgi:hypothetical protein